MTNPSDIVSGTNLSFDHGIARTLGINAAIVFSHITYWLRHNALKKNPDIKEDKIWMYETQKDISDFLGFMSEDDVFNAIKKLFSFGLLIKGNFNKTPLDRRNWYTTPNQLVFLSEKEFQKVFTKPSCDGMDPANMRNGNRDTTESSPYIQTEEQHEKNKQQQESVVVSSEKQKQQDHFKRMKSLGLSDKSIEKAFHQPWPDIENAIECCLNPPKPIENIEAYFHEALTKKWQPSQKQTAKPPEKKLSPQETNKQLAEKYDNMFNEQRDASVKCFASYVSIWRKSMDPVNISFSEKGFVEQFESALRKNNLFPTKKTQ